MDVSLLRFMGRKVHLKDDVTKREYEVAGINWDTEDLLIFQDDRPRWQHNSSFELLPEDDEES